MSQEVLGGPRRSQFPCRIVGNSKQKRSNSSFTFKLFEGGPRSSQEVLGSLRTSQDVLGGHSFLVESYEIRSKSVAIQVSHLNSLRGSQELLGGPRKSQEVLRGPRKSQEVLGGHNFIVESQEIQSKSVAIQVSHLNSLRGSQELLGGPRMSQEVLGGPRKS